MSLTLECYFDYRSPFPYLAIEPIAELAERQGVFVDWIPIRLPGLSSYRDRPMGHSFPKRNAYVARDLERWARRRGLEIRTPDVLAAADSALSHNPSISGDVAAQANGVFEVGLERAQIAIVDAH